MIPFRSKPLVLAALLLASGSLSDRFGHKGVLLSGLLVFGAASLLGGYASSPAELIAARAGMAIALGPIVGGFLLEDYSWSSVFFALAPVSLAVIVLTALCVPRTGRPSTRGLDVLGVILSGGFMGLLVYTLIEAPARGWTSTASIAGFAGSAVLLTAFFTLFGFSPALGYGIIAVQMVVYGLGMGLTSAPATESIMGAVDARQAGIGSTVVSGEGAAGAAVRQAAVGAFDHGLSVACVVAGAVAAGGALLAAAFLPAQAVPEHRPAEPSVNRRKDLAR